MESPKQLNIGLIGAGIVGGGVVKHLTRNADLIAERLGMRLNLKWVCDKDQSRLKKLSLPANVLTEDAQQVLRDDDVPVIVELVGGTGFAKSLILDALGRGKVVVTANKALLAHAGEEIFAAAAKNGTNIFYEASVCGGIPIIRALREGLAANRIQSIHGIINGTTNYILTKMTTEKAEYADVLKEAQKLGYAEADPTYDVEGVDSAHKLAILASLAFGVQYTLKDVHREGISWISPMDIEFAHELGYTLKLLGIAKETNGKVELRVHPTLLPTDFLISKVDGVFNAVYVEGDAVGSTLYYGRGAGDLPTGSAVVSDIVDISRHITAGSAGRFSAFFKTAKPLPLMKMEDVTSMYYFRFSAIDKPGVLSKISGILGKHNISIASVIQKDRHEGKAVPLVVLTHRAREKDVMRAVKEINRLPIVVGRAVYIRVENKEKT